MCFNNVLIGAVPHKFDRKNNFFLIPKLRFPIPNDPSFQKCHTDTIIDGELVLDKEPDGRVSYMTASD